MSMSMPVLVALATGVAMLALVLGLYSLLKPAGSLEERLQQTISHGGVLPVPGNPGIRMLGYLNTIQMDQKLAGPLALELAPLSSS